MIKKIAGISAAAAVAAVGYILVADPGTVSQAAAMVPQVRRRY